MPGEQTIPALQQRLSHLESDNANLLRKLREAEQCRDALLVRLGENDTEIAALRKSRDPVSKGIEMKSALLIALIVVLNAAVAFGIMWLMSSDLHGDHRVKCMLLGTPALFSALFIAETAFLAFLWTYRIK